MAFGGHKLGQAALGLACLFMLLGATTSANAGSLALNPVRLSLSARQPVTALTVRNDGDAPAVVQVNATKWTQVDGQNVYADTAEILATPPIFTVPAGGSQLVRVGLRRAADSDHELSYRVFLQEVPPPPAPDFKGLRVAVRFGVPVFIAPLAAAGKQDVRAAPSLQWRARVAAPGSLALNITNAGAVHAQVTQLTLTTPGSSQPLAKYTSPDYVLSGQHRELLIKVNALPPAGTPFHVLAGTSTGSVEADVTLDSP